METPSKLNCQGAGWFGSQPFRVRVGFGCRVGFSFGNWCFGVYRVEFWDLGPGLGFKDVGGFRI